MIHRCSIVLLAMLISSSGCTALKEGGNAGAPVPAKLAQSRFGSFQMSALERWKVQRSNLRENLRHVQFLDAQNGWVVADNGSLLQTNDGGMTWIRRKDSKHTQFIDAYFRDTQRGWAIGTSIAPRQEVLLETTDSGTHWVAKNIQDAFAFGGIDFIDSDNGWVFGSARRHIDNYISDEGVIAHTTDGGSSWSFCHIPSGPIDKDGPVIAASFVSAVEGWVIGSSVIRHTTDAGATWQIQHQQEYEPTDLFGFMTVQFLDSKTGWVTGYSDGETGYFTGLLRTSDGGKSWKRSLAEHPLISVRFLNSTTGVGVGMAVASGYRDNTFSHRRDGIIMLTADAGETWMEVFRVKGLRLFDVSFAEDAAGYAIGEGGTLLRLEQ